MKKRRQKKELERKTNGQLRELIQQEIEDRRRIKAHPDPALDVLARCRQIANFEELVVASRILSVTPTSRSALAIEAGVSNQQGEALERRMLRRVFGILHHRRQAYAQDPPE